MWKGHDMLLHLTGVVTGSGQTFVVVQEGDNISFVPAEMVQGDLGAAVNGGQVSIIPQHKMSSMLFPPTSQFPEIYSITVSHSILVCIFTL